MLKIKTANSIYDAISNIYALVQEEDGVVTKVTAELHDIMGKRVVIIGYFIMSDVVIEITDLDGTKKPSTISMSNITIHNPELYESSDSAVLALYKQLIDQCYGENSVANFLKHFLEEYVQIKDIVVTIDGSVIKMTNPTISASAQIWVTDHSVICEHIREDCRRVTHTGIPDVLKNLARWLTSVYEPCTTADYTFD